MTPPVSPICARAFGCGTLYHVRNAESKQQELVCVLGSTVPLKYRANVSAEPVNTAPKITSRNSTKYTVTNDKCLTRQ